MQIALGTDESVEYRDNLSLVSQVRLSCLPFTRCVLVLTKRVSTVHYGQCSLVVLEQNSRRSHHVRPACRCYVGACQFLQLHAGLFSRRYFESFAELDYARGGATVEEDVVIEPEAFTEFAMTFTMLEPLKKLGLNVQLKHGVLALEEPFTVCRSGDVLTPDQARLLVRMRSCCAGACARPNVFSGRLLSTEIVLEATRDLQD